jgi:hypothetical protein
LEFQALARVFAEYLPPIYPYQTGSGPSEIMQADFDGRVDVIPVSDPNIFSQSQRISMAQELMQLVQSNPEIHGPQGIYEAYRRMYAALGVDDIDSILQPPPQPQPPMPMDAGLENAGLLVGQPAQAFEQQNHRAHIEAHRNLFLTEVVKTNPQLQSMIISHMMQHLQFLATQMAQEQIPPELQQQVQQMSAQAGQIPPDQMMQMQSQMQMMMEQFSAPILAQMTQELMLSIGQGSQEDPLVRIREKETELREQELQSDNAQFAAKQEQRMQEKLLENELARERLRLNAETDTEKTQIARDRLEQQARLKLLELQAKFGGNIA